MASINSNVFMMKNCSAKEEMISRFFKIVVSKKLRQIQKKYLDHWKQEDLDS